MRRYLQFHLRDLLWAMLLLGFALAWWQERSRAVSEAKQAESFLSALRKAEEANALYLETLDYEKEQFHSMQSDLKRRLAYERELTWSLEKKLYALEARQRAGDAGVSPQ